MIKFSKTLPEGFRDKISQTVVTMITPKDKRKESSTNEDFNTELIFSRVMYLLGNGQLELSSVFNYELSPVPLALFSESGDARYPTSKAVLMNSMKSEVSSRSILPSVTIVDGIAMLHAVIHWPKDGTVLDLVNGVEKFIMNLLKDSDVYLVFDRYLDKSIKSDTRQNRIGKFQRSHQLTKDSDLPAKDICMASPKTKKSIVDILANHLLVAARKQMSERKLMITSRGKYPEECKLGVCIERQDLETHFD